MNNTLSPARPSSRFAVGTWMPFTSTPDEEGGYHASITAMPEYAQKSLEELRAEDYAVGRMGPPPHSTLALGGVPLSPSFPPVPPGSSLSPFRPSSLTGTPPPVAAAAAAVSAYPPGSNGLGGLGGVSVPTFPVFGGGSSNAAPSLFAPAPSASSSSGLFSSATGTGGLFNQQYGSTSTSGLFGNLGGGALTQQQQTTGSIGVFSSNSGGTGIFSSNSGGMGIFSSNGGLPGSSNSPNSLFAPPPSPSINWSPQPGGGTTVPLATVMHTDRSGHMASIAGMDVYANKSFEELRAEDYAAGRKGPSQGGDSLSRLGVFGRGGGGWFGGGGVTGSGGGGGNSIFGGGGGSLFSSLSGGASGSLLGSSGASVSSSGTPSSSSSSSSSSGGVFGPVSLFSVSALPSAGTLPQFGSSLFGGLAESSSPSPTSSTEASLSKLMEMGFSRATALSALTKSGGDLQRAASALMQQSDQGGQNGTAGGGGGGSSVNQHKKSEGRGNQKSGGEREASVCVMCQEREPCVLLSPCNHIASCVECLPLLTKAKGKECPVCRRKFETTMRVFLP
uniref:RING-type domain-containing protein n=1 Tax=Chromera velia CCMP2878 TaxID=1169474 RepID=A0A0G4GYH5_9ALVE|eukprot:Cvel_23924.t1-p1 / transcript=Cvel_23924.t1 / gene=Cvel_23924 / organism=Chromera_velia_CCMP2878 / gene_product=hypothetical protein / transcript_product=hypothetical protein / location=Cvel_scaffold2525:7346-11093(-) / protein_length=560 / sequence_SO=supercontig / SO=protein_coding / is_pseudo=false